jgi:hypothetical protein
MTTIDPTLDAAHEISDHILELLNHREVEPMPALVARCDDLGLGQH